MRGTLLQRYADRCTRGLIHHDTMQQHSLVKLDQLRGALALHAGRMDDYRSQLVEWNAQVARLRGEQRQAAERERERVAKLPFWRRWWEQAQQPDTAAAAVAPPAMQPIPTPTPTPATAAAITAMPTDSVDAAAACSNCGSTTGCGEGGGDSGKDAVGSGGGPEDHGLDPEHLQHPFWRTGLGSRALSQVGVMPSGGSGGAGDARGAGTSSGFVGAAIAAELPKGAPPPPERPQQPRGLFMYGTVGSGKTMLMDWFAEVVATGSSGGGGGGGGGGGSRGGGGGGGLAVRRVHYNAFMIECHARLHLHTLAHAAASRAADGGMAGGGGGGSGGGGGGGRWSVMGELVRYLVGEEKRPEHAPSLSEALSSISDSIVTSIPAASVGSAPGAGAATATTAGELPIVSASASTASISSTATASASAATSPAEPDAPSPPQLLDPAGAPISTGVLCFDEVQVMDVADAAIFTGVLERLFDAGWVLVATCNRSLGDFAQSHAHREHPQARFTREMRSRCELVEHDGADYRRQLAAAPQPTFFTPLDESSAAALDERFEQLTSGEAVSTEAPISFGRTLRLLACNARGVARCDFEKLCGGSFGAADYIALAQRYHTLVLTGLPRLSLRERDKARRFITLVDQLYNHKTLLIASAAAPPEQLFIGARLRRKQGPFCRAGSQCLPD